jgi:hypothetical protein
MEFKISDSEGRGTEFTNFATACASHRSPKACRRRCAKACACVEASALALSARVSGTRRRIEIK